nr:MAG TPA: hypothetical protein [Caudoviricetes sp.]
MIVDLLNHFYYVFFHFVQLHNLFLSALFTSRIA